MACILSFDSQYALRNGQRPLFSSPMKTDWSAYCVAWLCSWRVTWFTYLFLTTIVKQWYLFSRQKCQI